MAVPAQSPAELAPQQWGQPAPISGDLQLLPADSPFNFAISSSGQVRWVDPQRVEAEFGVKVPNDTDGLSYQVAPSLPAARRDWSNTPHSYMPRGDERRPSLLRRGVDEVVGFFACWGFIAAGAFQRPTPRRVTTTASNAADNAPKPSSIIASPPAPQADTLLPDRVRMAKPRFSHERLGHLEGIASGARVRLRALLLAGVEQPFIEQYEAGEMVDAQRHANNVLRAAELSQPVLRVAYLLDMRSEHRAALLHGVTDQALLSTKAGQQPMFNQSLSLEAWLTIAFANLGELDQDEFEWAARGAFTEISDLAAKYQQLRAGHPDYPDLFPRIPLPDDAELAQLAKVQAGWRDIDAIRAAAQSDTLSPANNTYAQGAPRYASVAGRSLLPEGIWKRPAANPSTTFKQLEHAQKHPSEDELLLAGGRTTPAQPSISPATRAAIIAAFEHQDTTPLPGRCDAGLAITAYMVHAWGTGHYPHLPEGEVVSDQARATAARLIETIVHRAAAESPELPVRANDAFQTQYALLSSAAHQVNGSTRKVTAAVMKHDRLMDQGAPLLSTLIETSLAMIEDLRPDEEEVAIEAALDMIRRYASRLPVPATAAAA